MLEDKETALKWAEAFLAEVLRTRAHTHASAAD
jgi:hypothetical protein